MTFTPDVPGAQVIPDSNFWKDRIDVWPVHGVVQHYTAGGNGRSMAKWLASKTAKASAHILICRDGHIIQQVRFRDRAFHAGEKMSKGFWRGAKQPTNVNHFTIGIENSNYGWIEKSDNDGRFYTRAGRPYNGPAPVRAIGHDGVERWWEPFTDKLIEANIKVLKVAVSMFPAITRENVVSHSSISPHRKWDPGPLWPTDYVLDAVFGSGVIVSGPSDIEAEDPPPYDWEEEMCVIGRGNNDDGEDEILG